MTEPMVQGWKVITTSDDFKTSLTSYGNSLTMVYFGQPNCPGCDIIRPTLQTFPTKYPTCHFVQIPFNSPVKTHYACSDVAVYPTVKVFKNYSEPNNRNQLQYYIGAGKSEIESLITNNK